MRVGILGAGFSGKAIGSVFADHDVSVWGTTRDDLKFDALRRSGIEPVMFDGTTIDFGLQEQLANTTHLIVSIAPPRTESLVEPNAPVDPVLTAFRDFEDPNGLPSILPKLEWIGYLSTVGVYGNHDGVWVDEGTTVAPQSARSRQRVRAEAEWLAVGEASNIPVGIFRLSGIYGPGRNGIRNALNGKTRRLVKPGQVFNRIYVGDIAQALWLAAQQNSKGIFNITDDEPAPPQDVVTHIHEIIGTKPPEEIDFATADLSPMARSFYGENKRVSNAKSKQHLGLVYAWPNYRVAMQRMWEENCWQGGEDEAQ